MRNKKIRNFILADILLLLILFLASSTDILIKEKEVEVHKIAVVVDVPVKGQVDNFRSGTMKASLKYHTDTNFINLSSWNDLADKQAVLLKELDNGCKGVILHCEEKPVVQAILEVIPADIPVLLYNEEEEDPCVKGSLGSDFAEECRLLTEVICLDENRAKGVVLVEPVPCTERVRNLHDQLQYELEADGTLVRRLEVDSNAKVQTLVRSVSSLLGGIFVSGDVSVLQMLGEGNTNPAQDISVYGVGFHADIRSLIEDGAITGTVVHRAYEAGYFSVEQMVAILNGENLTDENTTVESVLLTQENMYSSEVESIVFPYT